MCMHRSDAGHAQRSYSSRVGRTWPLVLISQKVSCNCGSYKRVKGRSHTVEKRKASHPQKPHATSQPSRFSHTPTLRFT